MFFVSQVCEATTKEAILPPVVTDLSAKPTANGVHLTWNLANGSASATAFDIQRDGEVVVDRDIL